MTARPHTIAEIDEMRTLVEYISNHTTFDDAQDNDFKTCIKSDDLERRLHTMLLGGVSLEQLREHWQRLQDRYDESEALWDKHYLAWCARTGRWDGVDYKYPGSYTTGQDIDDDTQDEIMMEPIE